MTARKQQVARLFAEGLEQIKQLHLVMEATEFFDLIELKTGLTQGARGGMSNMSGNGRPGIYIGTRGDGFDKETDFRRHGERNWREKCWKRAAELAREGKWQYVEYSHINNSEEIGAFISDDSDDHIRALMAHELAHAIHWWEVSKGLQTDKVEHGPAWINIYRALRRHWVNPKIKSD